MYKEDMSTDSDDSGDGSGSDSDGDGDDDNDEEEDEEEEEGESVSMYGCHSNSGGTRVEKLPSLSIASNTCSSRNMCLRALLLWSNANAPTLHNTPSQNTRHVYT